MDFAFAADSIDPARVNIYERWESYHDLMTFRNSDADAGLDMPYRDAFVRRYRVTAIEDA